jgi:hypothetical protein
LNQVLGQGFFISAFGMSNPPQTGKITERFFLRPNNRWIFTYLQQLYAPKFADDFLLAIFKSS